MGASVPVTLPDSRLIPSASVNGMRLAMGLCSNTVRAVVGQRRWHCLELQAATMCRWHVCGRRMHLSAEVLARRVAVRREHHDVVAGGAQALDEALEPVLHAAHVAERAGLL